MEHAWINSTALVWIEKLGRFEEQPFQNVVLSSMDIGSLYGAVVIERLRTFRGQINDWQMHWERFRNGCDALGIHGLAHPTAFENSIRQLVQTNADWIRNQQDVSIVIAATPGNPEFELGSCTMYMHCLPLPWKRLAQWYLTGATLVRSNYNTGAGTSWPAPIKVRNRLPYYLADRDAETKSPGALGLVGNCRGNVGDTSVANVIVIDAGGSWISPTDDSVLLGTSLQRSARLLAKQNIHILHREIAWDELVSAQEILLVGNSGCVWHVAALDGNPIANETCGPECERLQNLWIDHLGFDWRRQAIDRR